MTHLAGFDIPFPPWVVLPVYLGLVAALSFFVGGVLRTILTRAASRTESRFDDVLAYALPGPLAVALFFGGMYLALVALPLPPAWKGPVDKLFRLVLIVQLIVAMLRLLVGWVGEYTSSHPSLAPASNIAKILTRIFVLA